MTQVLIMRSLNTLKNKTNTFGDGCCQSGFAMIYMTNSAYIAMRFITAIYFLLRIEPLTDNSRKEQPAVQLTTLL